MISLFNTLVKAANGAFIPANVLAGPDLITPLTAIEVATNAAVAAVGSDAIPQSTSLLGNVDLDASDSSLMPLSLFATSVRTSTGVTIPLNVLANPEYYSASGWVSGTTYALSTPTVPVRATYAGKTWYSLQASNTNHVPDVSPTWWAEAIKPALNVAIEAALDAAGGSATGSNVTLSGVVDIDAT